MKQIVGLRMDYLKLNYLGAIRVHMQLTRRHIYYLFCVFCVLIRISECVCVGAVATPIYSFCIQIGTASHVYQTYHLELLILP